MRDVLLARFAGAVGTFAIMAISVFAGTLGV